METEMRSAPDLRRLREAFLWATMKGTSELANDDEIKKRAIKTEIRDLLTGLAIDAGVDSDETGDGGYDRALQQ